MTDNKPPIMDEERRAYIYSLLAIVIVAVLLVVVLVLLLLQGGAGGTIIRPAGVARIVPIQPRPKARNRPGHARRGIGGVVAIYLCRNLRAKSCRFLSPG